MPFGESAVATKSAPAGRVNKNESGAKCAASNTASRRRRSGFSEQARSKKVTRAAGSEMASASANRDSSDMTWPRVDSMVVIFHADSAGGKHQRIPEKSERLGSFQRRAGITPSHSMSDSPSHDAACPAANARGFRDVRETVEQFDEHFRRLRIGGQVRERSPREILSIFSLARSGESVCSASSRV